MTNLASTARARIVAHDRQLTTTRQKRACLRVSRSSIILRSTAAHAAHHLITDVTPSKHIIDQT